MSSLLPRSLALESDRRLAPILNNTLLEAGADLAVLPPNTPTYRTR